MSDKFDIREQVQRHKDEVIDQPYEYKSLVAETIKTEFERLQAENERLQWQYPWDGGGWPSKDAKIWNHVIKDMDSCLKLCTWLESLDSFHDGEHFITNEEVECWKELE